jgi:hypothetical protein
MKVFFMRFCTSIFIALYACNISASEKKVALIWGNATYLGQWQSLDIVRNDANTMDKVFKSLGFETKLLSDGNLNEMKSSLKDFASMAKNADIAVFYYSGHATRLNDSYYIVPAKTYLGNDILSSDLLPAQDIITALKSSRLQLLFFDSCRDDATIEGVSKGNPNIVSANNVGPVTNYESNSPSGTMLCYASERGKKAYTGSGNLSTFTKVLSEHLTDGDEFRTVWANIITDVYLIQKQRPVNDGFYQHDLYLNPTGRRHIVPSQSTTQNSDHITTPTINNKKSISIIPNVAGAIIDFYGTKYEAGKSLLYEIGKTYTYTITANGYKSYIGSLTITETTPSTISITMQKNEAATFTVTSNTNANISFDGKSIGSTPITINTTSGTHTLSVSADDYYEYSSKVDLYAGANSKHISLTHKKSWFWDWDGDGLSIISYYYGNNYPIGISYMYRPENYKFSFGAVLGVSTGLFRGWNFGALTTVSQTTSISIGTGNNTTDSKEEISTIDGSEEPYSDFIDPYDEAKHYDAFALLLANIGYNICNGIMVELGVGAGYHRDLYYMDHTYLIKKTTKTNTNTGEVTESPYVYEQQTNSNWYKENGKWSPAMRLGVKFNIPAGSDNYITLGGGYTHLFSNTKYSSWDISLGFAWEF